LYSKTFQQLDNYLTELQLFWKFEAFHHGDYPWRSSHPALSEFLDGLSDLELQHYQQNPALLQVKLSPFIESLRQLDDPLFNVDALCITDTEVPFWLTTGIKGRKWSQISAFAQQVNNQQPIVEWCAGKGHLGRLISWQQQLPVTSVEWQQKLCDLGTQLSEKMQLQQTFKQADVLQGEADGCIHTDCHAIALHACGDLHLHLIELAKKERPKQLTISPCCYHLTEQAIYQACSGQGKASALRINKQELKLAVSKQATSGARQARLGEQEVLWRLAFDELQKHFLKTEDYLPLPSFPKTLLSASFNDFVGWAKDEKSLTFAQPDALQPFLDLAKERLKKVRRMELLSQFFVRPLELWLVYDRALALQESGYQVQLSTFCEPQITPRNLLIQATMNRPTE